MRFFSWLCARLHHWTEMRMSSSSGGKRGNNDVDDGFRAFTKWKRVAWDKSQLFAFAPFAKFSSPSSCLSDYADVKIQMRERSKRKQKRNEWGISFNRFKFEEYFEFFGAPKLFLGLIQCCKFFQFRSRVKAPGRLQAMCWNSNGRRMCMYEENFEKFNNTKRRDIGKWEKKLFVLFVLLCVRLEKNRDFCHRRSIDENVP